MVAPAGPGSGEARVRPSAVLFAVVIAVAFGGFAIGTTDYDLRPAPRPEQSLPVAAAGEVRSSPTYLGMRVRPPGDLGAWEGDRARLEAPIPALLDEVLLAGTDKAATLAARARRRAYDGAPPTVPHPVGQDRALECAACHARGAVVRGRLAPPIPHEEYATCTQCHVVETAPMPIADWLPPGPPLDNAFRGRGSPKGGDRWGSAPPEVPHRTLMRERCDSCHGPAGRDAIRSSHPWRRSCTQCHALDAGLDQRPQVSR